MCTPPCFTSDMAADIRDSALTAIRLAGASLDVDASIRAHDAWNRRLNGYLDHHHERWLDANQIADDHCCVLGQWLYTDGAQHLGGYHCFLELQQIHQQFHLVAAEVVCLTRDFEHEKASDLAAGELARLSQEISHRLEELKLLQQPPRDVDELV